VQRPLGVGQQPLRIPGRDLGQVSQLAGDPPDHCLRLVSARRRAQLKPKLRDLEGADLRADLGEHHVAQVDVLTT
jgi:hypothetical protein